ncbi:hypothetical protein [Neobacillus niacini]|uniref:hypothetical protein n=1 Tax=Neobacillus niacini TaxID=86668 RepID=UPI002854C639|nr:hypothetical protein [Neobacillus niacini]MDR6999675.1 hypothetical protein [Neobacillus niacini]
MSGNVTVITYENPYTFHEKLEFQPYVNCPHICATRALTAGVKRKFKLPFVESTGEIIDMFYPDWNLPENRFIQYSQLSDILRNWDKPQDSKVLRSFKRNKLNLLITMRNFTEIGLRPQDLRPHVKKIEEQFFCDLWVAMLPNFKVYMDEAAKKIADLEQVREVFRNANIPLRNDIVVLHGFYYISPVQHYLFTKWKELGINIVILNLYHADYPSVFSFLNENFSDRYGWARNEDWQITRDDAAMNSRLFAAYFDGKDMCGELQNIAEKPYDYMVEFMDDFKNGIRYVSPNSDELKKRLKEFRPDSFLKDRHFLSYPIGQYLFHLHSIWNEEKQDYYLTEKILMESFASGWLQYEGENARQYTTELKAVLPYFANCQTADDWVVQFQMLIDAKRSSAQIFKNYHLQKDDYLEAVRVSPVLRFSYFSVPLRELTKLQGFVEKLVKDAKWLVNIKEERITIKTHFQRIQQLLDDSNLKSSLTDTIEGKLVEHLEELLSKPIRKEHYYHVGDLADAIVVFLKNGLEDPDNELGSSEIPAGVTDEEAGVKPIHLGKMADLDGLILLDDFEELHLCGMDEKHFPETTSPSPWPLSFDSISKLNNHAADMYIFRKENSLAFSRYLFFVALSFNRKICFSWVKNWNEYEELDKSIYIQLLEHSSDGEADGGSYDYMPPAYIPEGLNPELVYQKIGKLPQEEFAEMSLCKRRFIYSSIVDGYATYRSSFHQGFLIGNLVKVYASTGKNKTEIIDMLQQMFPYMTEITLRTIVDQNMNEDYVAGMRKYGLGKRRKFADIEYPESMLYFQFLTHRGAFQNEMWQSAFTPVTGIRRQKSEMIQKMANQTGVLTEASPSVFCKLCPHAEYCEDAYYAVDISKKGFDENDIDAAGI